jgi:hypothetical protein
LGTSGSLVAAAVCVFVIASAVIAFKGWPGIGLSGIRDLVLEQSPPISPSRSAVPPRSPPPACRSLRRLLPPLPRPTPPLRAFDPGTTAAAAAAEAR